jgi:glycosyltransferase involved in cell wall biosynthesis
MSEVSVVICSHNPRPGYLKRTLAGLRAQDLAMTQWQLLLVDNASSSPLTSYDLSWHPNGRYVLEPELGLSFARRRGIVESLCDIIVFVDDDNLLEADFLSRVIAIGEQQPQLGAWGGNVIAEFETTPSAGVMKHIGYLALRSRTRSYSSSSPLCTDAVPIGAGMCVRSVVAKAYIEHSRSEIKLTGRKGGELGGYDDIEICHVACKMGFEIGTFPELRLLHLIPPERVSEDYFVRLIEATDYSGFLLSYKWHGTIPKSLFSLYNMAAFAKHTLLDGSMERRICLARTRARRAARRYIFEL